MSKKILVVSDVHGDIKILQKILNYAKNKVDLRVFAGDLQKKDFSIISENFDYYVIGNSDYFLENIESKVIFDFEEVRFFLTHGHLYETIWNKIDFKNLIKEAKIHKAKIIIHGHDHIKANVNTDSIIRFNSGSTTFPRDGLKGSFGIIEVENKKIKNIEHIFINLL